MDVSVRQLVPGDVPACEGILASLSHWFGIEESNRAYVRSLTELPGYVAEVDGAVAGFTAIKNHNPASSEVYVLAVDPSLHRRGVGRALIEAIESELTAAGVKILQVKTLGPSRQDEGYARTRLFYEAMGFVPLEEIPQIWNPQNPCLIMVKPLSA